MLKKMRCRMVSLAIVSFFIVIMLVAVMVNVINYYVVTERADKTLHYIARFEKASPAAPRRGTFMELPNREDNYMTRFFSVRLKDDGEIAGISTDYIAEIDDAKAAEYAQEVLRRSNATGYIDSYRYAVSEVSEYKIISFLNVAKEQNSMKSLLLLSIAVAMGSLALVSLIIILLSGKAIRPFAANIENQKQFITNAGHELKTPLTSISTSIDVIALEHGEDEWVANVKNQVVRMTRLVSELVMLSRLDEDTPFPDMESFSLSEVAGELVAACGQQAKALTKEFRADIQDDLYITGDKSAFQKMISALLDNAIKYSDAEGKIFFKAYKKKGKTIIETFNTCAFSELPDVNRLFDRFYRPDSARSEDTGGTGIGLSIAKAVAEKHGGTISAECPDEHSILFRVIL